LLPQAVGGNRGPQRARFWRGGVGKREAPGAHSRYFGFPARPAHPTPFGSPPPESVHRRSPHARRHDHAHPQAGRAMSDRNAFLSIY
jgi:hypothetical protein